VPGGILAAADLQVAVANLKTIEGLRNFLKSDKSHKTQKITPGPHCCSRKLCEVREISGGASSPVERTPRNLDLAVSLARALS
jgi:hypothetical protein